MGTASICITLVIVSICTFAMASDLIVAISILCYVQLPQVLLLIFTLLDVDSPTSPSRTIALAVSTLICMTLITVVYLGIASNPNPQSPIAIFLLPCYMFAFGPIIYIVVYVAAKVLSRRWTFDTTVPICNECGYNLTGNTSDRCPECGMQIDAMGTIAK
ncbi:MAG: hypothetical protein DCC65_16515 [Planctomycetota bacterium]|nr:MAG: hypothetical protein DCC65_16515 [Planctomycetota bacterium]